MSNATFVHSTARRDTVPHHPLGSRAWVLLTSVFGPYAQDDDYGSRIINPMELYHNQVTRVQHAFSLRTFNRSWGLMMIQANLRAPVTLLDFPSKERFMRDVADQPYGVVRIVRTTLRAWKRYRHHPDLRVRARFAHEAANLDDRYAGALWATREWYRDDPRQASAVTDLLAELHAECGERSRRAAPIVGRRLHGNLVREERRLREGWTYEPPTFYETNFPGGPPGSVFIDPIRGAAEAVTPW